MQRLDVGRRPGEHGRAREGTRQDRARGHEQHVVVDPLVVGRLDRAPGDVDAGELGAPLGEARVGGETLERIAPGASGCERRKDAERAVRELGVGRQQGRGDAVARETVEPQRSLQRRGASRPR